MILKRHLQLSVLLCGTAMSASLLAQAFSVRTGTWQFTLNTKGGPPIEGVPPAVRAQLEAELRKPQVFSSCVTSEDIKQLNLGRTDDSDAEECKVLTSKIGPTTADITRQCTGDEAFTETVHFEATTPQTLRANISRKGAGGTTAITMSGKWVAAQCKE